MKGRTMENKEGKTLSRRAFFGGAAATGVVAASSMFLGGCAAPQENDASATNSGGISKEAEEYAEAAAPIAPVEAPVNWDLETDVIVVGSGAGGMSGALRLVEEGNKVILLEKDEIAGGASRYAGHFVNFGGHRMANEYEWAMPEYPYNPEKVVEYLNDIWQMSADPHLLYAMAVEGPKCIDWMTDSVGVEWEPYMPIGMGSGNLHMKGQLTETNSIMINDGLFKYLSGKAEEVGVDLKLNSPVEALVQDGDTIVGVKALVDGAETFIRASKAVLLTAGGFEMNRAMMQEYMPGCLKGTVNVACPPCNTGECIRMGIGAGADMAGRESMMCYDGGVEWGEYGEHSAWMNAHVNKDGNQGVRQPWLRINQMGERVPWLNTFEKAYPYGDMADNIYSLTNGSVVEMTQPGGRTFVCFDSKFEELVESNYFKEGVCRPGKVIDPADPLIDRVPEWQRDWKTGFGYMVDAGAVKKCDTIEELEAELGLRKGMLVDEVEKWNAACEAGEDYVEVYKYKPEWLIAIDEPPYYGAKIGGNLFTTKCGLRVNPSMQVIDTEGLPIKGLYAGFHTAGGSNGEMSISGKPFGGMYGDVAASLVGGYMAAGGIVSNE